MEPKTKLQIMCENILRKYLGSGFSESMANEIADSFESQFPVHEELHFSHNLCPSCDEGYPKLCVCGELIHKESWFDEDCGPSCVIECGGCSYPTPKGGE